jgi:hypothetical protein
MLGVHGQLVAEGERVARVYDSGCLGVELSADEGKGVFIQAGPWEGDDRIGGRDFSWGSFR